MKWLRNNYLISSETKEQRKLLVWHAGEGLGIFSLRDWVSVLSAEEITLLGYF